MAVRLRLRIPEVADPDFAADVVFSGEATLRLTGSADSHARRQLGELLAQLHAEVGARKLAAVVVDMSALDAMAATCFNELLDWLGRVQELAEAERYKFRFRLNPTVAWQGNCVKALSCFDTALVAIEA